jgi:LysM repeat protein
VWYTVQSGDSLQSISARFGIPVEELIRVNNLRPPFTIYFGQQLWIPIRPTPPRDDVDRRLRRLEERVDRLEREVRELDRRVDRLEVRPRPR